jgi:hypothetical protein
LTEPSYNDGEEGGRETRLRKRMVLVEYLK